MKKISAMSGRESAPVRNIGKSKFGKQTTIFPSRKNGCLVICETRLEADACYQWEYDAEVVSYRAQPKVFHLCVNDEPRKYTPDFEVIYKCGLIKYVEVKMANVKQKPKYQAVFRAMRCHLPSGQSFQLLTNEQIRQEPKLSNMKNIYYQSRNVNPLEVDYLLGQLSAVESPISITKLLQGPYPPTFGAIAMGVFTHALRIDFNKRVTTNSQVYWEQQK